MSLFLYLNKNVSPEVVKLGMHEAWNLGEWRGKEGRQKGKKGEREGRREEIIKER